MKPVDSKKGIAPSRVGLKNKAEAQKPRADFLLEIGCEEIPAGMIPKAAAELKAILVTHFSSHGLVDEPTVEESFETFGAPRRLVAIVHGVRVKQEDVTKEITGPPKSVAFDSVGEPTRAAMSFAEKQGVPVSRLNIIETPKGPYVAVKQTVLGKSAVQVLGEILPQAIREIAWPR